MVDLPAMTHREGTLKSRQGQLWHSQIRSTEEVILYKGCSPQDYAAKIWRSLGQNAIFTPLDGLVSDGDLDRLVKPVFTQKTIEMARSWVVAEGVANPYKMLWVVAIKGT